MRIKVVSLRRKSRLKGLIQRKKEGLFGGLWIKTWKWEG